MTTTTYKGYKIRITGLSHEIFRPGQDTLDFEGKEVMSPGFEQSMAAAKRWINQDIKDRTPIVSLLSGLRL